MTVKPYQPLHPAIQIAILLLCCISGIAAGGFIAMGLAAGIYGLDILSQLRDAGPHVTDNVVNALRLVQGISAAFGFAGAAIFYSYVVVREPNGYLKMNIRFSPLLLLMVLVVMIASQPFMEALINMNQQMVLPESLKGLEKWMRESENTAQQQIEAMLKMNSIGDLIANMLVIAFLAALGEELVFRGCLQTILTRWTRNQHTAIWITAIVFSAIHLEFYGFVPRMVLGIFFGYFVAWSGSIWPGVLAHFINNGSAVLLTYLYQHKQINIDPNAQPSFNYTTYALSVIITLFLMLNYRTAALHRPRTNNY
ncbi:CPBP family intramembrane glutamic endopeptidase [Mucilaginibacter lacusdianchii]|uniref:CPBP family intramembrane glutamic endopeptidase n=1 Tax=Mucilaginibacter lacusdianchii TaxID=2684211 RepID=UPI00131E5976|nr:CPBP family intramembrane glutamic endopeptidase [Mucilaginibacter sp. JXJ CY 39]